MAGPSKFFSGTSVAEISNLFPGATITISGRAPPLGCWVEATSLHFPVSDAAQHRK